MNAREIRKRIKALVSADRPAALRHPGGIVNSMYAELSPEDVKRLACDSLLASVLETLRADARRVEERSTHAAGFPPPPAATPAKAEPRHQSYARSKKGRQECHRCRCEACTAALLEYGAQEEAIASKSWAKVTAAIKDYADAIRLEVTEELLASTFALGDGRQVTWADATVEDHQVRIKLLETNAVKNIETASKHQAAIQMLQGAGVPRLGLLERVPA